MMPVEQALVWSAAVVAAFAAAATLTTWLIPFLIRYGAIAPPGPDGYGRPLPRGGGLAIALVCLVGGLVASWLFPASRILLAAWLAPAAVVAGMSLLDDFQPLSPLLRLAVHGAAAVVVVAVAGPIREVSLGSFGRLEFGAAALPLTVFWIVGMTNAFNFMDGIDGIAGLTAAAVGGVLTLAAAEVGGVPAAVVAASLMAGSLGFLTSNWPPAKVFMGDIGSTFCGFTIAVFPLLVPPSARSGLVPIVVVAMWPFLCDASLTLVKRLLRRENILEQHRGHLYQRLVLAGWSHRGVAGLYGCLSLACGSLAVLPLVAPSLRVAAEGLAVAMMVVVPVSLLAFVQISEAGGGCRAAS